MGIFESKMTGNVYNKMDAETWCIIPRFSETKRAVYLDVNDLVLIDPKILTDEKDELQDTDINELFNNINNTLLS